MKKPFCRLPNSVAVIAVMLLALVTPFQGLTQNVIVWGNLYARTNVLASATNVVAVAAGGFHCLALRGDGSVIGWGDASSGATVPAEATGIVAIEAGYKHSLALKQDGTVLAWGDNTYGQTNVPAAATNVRSIAAGLYFNIAAKDDGTLVLWGKIPFFAPSPLSSEDVAQVFAGGTSVVTVRRDGISTSLWWV